MKYGGAAGTSCRRFAAPGTVPGVARLQRQAREYLEAEGLAGERLERLDLALGEALMNAFEHGCLRMGADKKRLLLAGEYDDLIMTALPRAGEEILVTINSVKRKNCVQVWVEVADPGPGMDEQRASQRECHTALSGRGYAMMRRSVDLVRRNPAGNRILLMQMFNKEDV